jgi:CxxC motif-containing protein (DUF1111 family)
LKAPIPRNQKDPIVKSGAVVFTSIGCNGCHIETLTTPISDIQALSEKTFHPYTDLLLHDMGPGLDDGATEGLAETYEWKTPALWGLGLSPDSQGGNYYLLHDGRARSIDEAIRLHGGEATESRDNYTGLAEADREALLKFLEAL